MNIGDKSGSFEIPAELVEAFRAAEHVVAFTGAGTSAESGVPTFREAQTGLWAQYDPEQLATPQAFRRDPALVWEWYSWRRDLVSRAEPNPGHYALAQLSQMVPRFTLITQNVDGLHQRAGSSEVIELHGSIQRTVCFDRGHLAESWDEESGDPPRCNRCGSQLRPDVVWFGESLPATALSPAVAAARKCDLFLSVGTSSLVHPAAALPVEAMRNRAVTVEINPNKTPLSAHMSFVLAGPSGVVLPSLVAVLAR